MGRTRVYLGNDGRDLLIKGLNLLADSVQSTLGPSGKTVIIHTGGREPFISKDGVTVAKEVIGETPVENTAVTLVRNVSIEMDKVCNDGTTSATVIARSIINNISSMDGDYRASKVKDSFLRQSSILMGNLRSLSIPVTYSDKAMTYSVAMTASNGDKELSTLLSEAIFKSKGGHVNLIRNYDTDSCIEEQSGYVLDVGMMEPYFANNKLTGFFESENCKLFITESEIMDDQEFRKFLKDNHGSDILIIARDFSRGVIDSVRYYNANNAFKVCLIKNSRTVTEMLPVFEDLNVITGAVTQQFFHGMSIIGGKCFGKVVVKQGYTVFDFDNTSIEFNSHVEFLREKLMDPKIVQSSKNQIEKRLGKLEQGVITLKLGSPTLVELEERMDRAVDAYNSVRNSMIEGVVPGAGFSVLKAITIDEYSDESSFSNEFKRSVLSPMLQILKNADLEEKEVNKIINKCVTEDLIYNSRTGDFENVDSTKVLDPLFVIKHQIELAISIAFSILSTECLIVED